MFGNLGMSEILMVLVIVLLVFGAKRLPEIGSAMGKGIREFKRSMREVTEEIDRPEPPAEPRRLAPPEERRQG
ncbi:MAG: twin-arginine translocase TatA/TatE family subunit [Gemmatimonadota bacterium]|jgi:sec-independent protein translocase protein TatA|nr:twin-arginine translocase TatA/TatE family subunit [Gemmatimonadales bacterium]